MNVKWNAVVAVVMLCFMAANILLNGDLDYTVGFGVFAIVNAIFSLADR